MLRQTIRAIMKPAIARTVVIWSFSVAADAWMALNRIVGWTYTRAWPVLGVSWFDHRFDYLLGPRHWYWSERGVFGSKVIRQGDSVLDICCGDGFYSGLFYASKARSVDAFDRDPQAIAVARRRYSRPNVRFRIADALRDPFPQSGYNVVTLFSAIEHFSDQTGTELLQKIADALSQEDGILLGSTPIFGELGGHNDEHENEFLSIEQLEIFLKPHFEQVEFWTSPWPNKRLECYFCCKGPIRISPERVKSSVENYRSFLNREEVLPR